jgi:proteic killer suppression protein
MHDATPPANVGGGAKCEKCAEGRVIHIFVNILKIVYLCGVFERKMIVTFEHIYLRELYESGTTSDKKHRFQPDIVKRYKDRIKLLMMVASKQELYPITSLHFEALLGEKQGRFSVRVNKKYRIEFTIDENVEQPILTICNIIELSNHYD